MYETILMMENKGKCNFAFMYSTTKHDIYQDKLIFSGLLFCLSGLSGNYNAIYQTSSI